MNHDDLTSFLNQVRDYKCQVRRCEYQIAELQSKCEKATTSWGECSGQGAGDFRKDSDLISLAEKKEALVRLRKEQGVAVTAVESFLSNLPDYRYRTIMQMRYVDLLRWGEIASELEASGLPYSERHIYNLHKKAMLAATKLWEEAHKHDETTLPAE